MAISAIVATVASTGMSYIQGQKQDRAQKKQLAAQKTANQKAAADAQKQQQANEIAQNKANRRSADTSAINAQAEAAAQGGGAGTMLTGNQGIDPEKLKLGGNTLLGG